MNRFIKVLRINDGGEIYIRIDAIISFEEAHDSIGTKIIVLDSESHKQPYTVKESPQEIMSQIYD